jgi:hypothetical protein
MPQARASHRLPDSERRPAAGARRLGPAPADETLTVTVRVRRPPDAPPLPDHEHWMATPPGRRRFLSHEEYAQAHGAAQQDLDAVARFVHSEGMRVVEVNPAGCTVSLAGTVAQMNHAFGVDLGRYQAEGATYRGRDGFVHVPAELGEVVLAVFGLDNRRVGYHNGTGDPPITGPLRTLDAAQLYNFPAFPAADAAGQAIGIVELGGGYDAGDLKIFFTKLGVAGLTPPTTLDVSISGSNGGSTAPGAAEVTGDICVAASVAPKATIQVYFGSDSLSGSDWFTVLNRVAHPLGADPPAPDVVSISWTLIGADDQITPGGLVSTALVKQISAVFQEMAALGMTVFVASGDGGSNGWNNPAQADGKAHVVYPASDPWVTGCGGTTIGFATPSSKTPEEWVWNEPGASFQEATGGGVSAFFMQPSWQQDVTIPASISFPGQSGRGVPDVAGNASLVSGYPIWVDAPLPSSPPTGTFSGTSAVAPLYAGLAALLNKQLGQRIGFLNPTLYAFRDTVCHDVNAQLFSTSPQDNGLHGGGGPQDAQGYPSVAGWDACTGLGTIDGGALLGALSAVFHKDCQWVIDRSQIGETEVSAQNPSVAKPALVPNAFYVLVDGLKPADLGITPASLTPPPNVAPTFTAVFAGTSNAVPGMSVVATALLAEDDTTDKNGQLLATPQRFTWVCEASFTDATGFAGAPVAVTLTAAFPSVGLSAKATIELTAHSDPFELDGPVSWLSTDLRVFQVETGNALAGLPAATALTDTISPAGPTQFIQGVVSAFNGIKTPPPNHPFDLISTDEVTSEVTLDTNGPNGKPVHNFAVARVRYQSAVAADKVRVFFRLFQAMTTSTAYDPNTYGSFASGGQNGFKIPLFGVDGAGNVVAIPCFASPRVAPGTALSGQTDPTNVVASIAADPAGGVTYAYFGCWLDINQQPWTQPAVPKTPPALPADSVGPFNAAQLETVTQAIADIHQCVVAEISYDDDPVQPGATPASSDKLAQRNLVIVQSDNPGGPASHRIPHTLDLRPTSSAAAEAGAPDELMIQWGNTPAGSTAMLYLPGVSAAQVLELAARMYPRHLLEWVDAHTLRCRVAGATYLPLPAGAGNYAGLFTLDLPPTVRKGQAFKIVTRQLASLADPNGRILPRGGHRIVLGSYQLSIPVSTAKAILPSEERKLAALRAIARGLSPRSRWAPVFARYLKQMSARVKALGGHPDEKGRDGDGKGDRDRDQDRDRRQEDRR